MESQSQQYACGVAAPMWRATDGDSVRNVERRPVIRPEMMKSKKSMMKDEASIAKPIAPEDVRRGMYVALLHEVDEKSCFWCDCADDEWRKRPKRFELSLPWDVDAQRVKAVCLPFVLTETKSGEIATIDTRRYRIARLPEHYGRAAFAKLRKERAKEKAEQAKAAKDAAKDAGA